MANFLPNSCNREFIACPWGQYSISGAFSEYKLWNGYIGILDKDIRSLVNLLWVISPANKGGEGHRMALSLPLYICLPFHLSVTRLRILLISGKTSNGIGFKHSRNRHWHTPQDWIRFGYTLLNSLHFLTSNLSSSDLKFLSKPLRGFTSNLVNEFIMIISRPDIFCLYSVKFSQFLGL